MNTYLWNFSFYYNIFSYSYFILWLYSGVNYSNSFISSQFLYSIIPIITYSLGLSSRLLSSSFWYLLSFFFLSSYLPACIYYSSKIPLLKELPQNRYFTKLGKLISIMLLNKLLIIF